MNEVTSLASRTLNSKAWSPTDAIRDALRRIEEGEVAPNKVVVIMLTDTNTGYHTNYSQAQMSCSEMILLLEIQKQIFLREMGL